MKQPAQSIYTACLIVVTIIILFQSCSDPLGNSEDQSSFAASLPFAFDSTLDTIGYMSCAGGPSGANRDAIWTLRAGAFGNGQGIHLTDAFLSLTSNFSTEQRAAALAESPLNQGAVLQLAVRQALNYQSVLTSGGGGGQLGEDYDTLLGPLDDQALAQKLAAVNLTNPARQSYFPGIPGLAGRSIRGTLRFTKDETSAQSVRGQLSNSGILTATYSTGGVTETQARGPGGAPDDKIYGRGYKLSFVAPSASEPEPRVMSSVDEINLETGRPHKKPKAWGCPMELRLRIHRTCDANCVCTSDPVGNPNLEIVRRVVKVEHWYVDMDHRCIVQKEIASQCYATTGPADNYHFVSICVRQ